MSSYESQIEFIRWKEEILQRCEEFVDARHAEALKPVKNVNVTTRGNTVVTVRPMDGGAGWEVFKNGQKMHVFFGKDAQVAATSYADKVLNGVPLLSTKTDVENTKSGGGYYDRRPTDLKPAEEYKPLFALPERCLFCGGYYAHRDQCPGEPKLGPDQEPSGSK